MSQPPELVHRPSQPLNIVRVLSCHQSDPETQAMKFHHLMIIFTDEQDYYYYHYSESHRLPENVAPLAALATYIPRDFYQAQPPPGLLFAPQIIPDDTYLKLPCITITNEAPERAFLSPTFAEFLVKEALVLHELAKSPHPNIVEYRGIYVQDGVMTGICLKKYDKTLDQCVEDHDQLDVPSVIGGIESGLKHLHSLGFVHGDINPRNIMFGAGDLRTPVIIDFDSCLQKGERIVMKGGTPGWYLKDGTDVAKVANDGFGLNAIRDWLEREYAPIGDSHRAIV